MPTASTYSQEPAADQRLIPDRSREDRTKSSSNQRIPKGLFGDASLMHFRLRGGHLQLDPVHYRKGKQSFKCDAFEESITVSTSGGVPSTYYQFEDDFQRLRLSAEYGKSLRIESTILNTGERAVLQQTSGKGIQWDTRRNPNGESALDVTVTGATLLHLIAKDAAGYEIHLENVLRRMLRGRSVINIANRTQRYLLAHSEKLAVVTAAEVDGLVQQLRADRASQRRCAAIALTRLASGAVPHLRAALARDRLDPEQVSRVRAILRSQGRNEDDTPASLAYLLSADRTHWQSIAHQMNRQQWSAANEHLQLCGLTQLRR